MQHSPARAVAELLRSAQGKTEVQDARRPAGDARLPVVVQRRKGGFDLDEEARVCAACVLASRSLTRLPRCSVSRRCWLLMSSSRTSPYRESQE